MNFHNYSAMKKMVCEVLAYTLIPEQITDLRSEFEKIDVDKTGEFTIEQFRTALRESEHISDEECDQIFMDMDIEHEGKVSERSERALDEDENTRDESREMATYIMATSTTKLTHSIRLARLVSVRSCFIKNAHNIASLGAACQRLCR